MAGSKREPRSDRGGKAAQSLPPRAVLHITNVVLYVKRVSSTLFPNPGGDWRLGMPLGEVQAIQGYTIAWGQTPPPGPLP